MTDLPQNPKYILQGSVNWTGVWTLYTKEVRRYLKIIGQTIIAPVVTTFLFLTVFTVAFGADRVVNGLPYIVFLTPGLIMMSILQNSFANASTSIIQQKLNQNIVDTLMPPLTSLELTAAFILGGVTRGLMVAIGVSAALTFFSPFHLHSIWFVLFHGIGAALLMASAGVMTGVWAEKFDHVSTVTNFVILPLSFLSGTFFTVQRFPDSLLTITQFNPFFYMIDGFRYGFTGQADGNVVIGLAVVSLANLGVIGGCYVMFRTGYKLRN